MHKFTRVKMFAYKQLHANFYSSRTEYGRFLSHISRILRRAGKNRLGQS